MIFNLWIGVLRMLGKAYDTCYFFLLIYGPLWLFLWGIGLLAAAASAGIYYIFLHNYFIIIWFVVSYSVLFAFLLIPGFPMKDGKKCWSIFFRKVGIIVFFGLVIMSILVYACNYFIKFNEAIGWVAWVFIIVFFAIPFGPVFMMVDASLRK